jgi:hypothetical protein
MIRYNNFRRFFPGVVALAALLAPSPGLRASEELRKGVAEMAKSLKQLLDGRGEKEIAIGAFTGPPKLPGAGPGIQQLLTEELKKLDIKVTRQARLGIKGEYLVTEVPAEDGQRKELAVLLKGSVSDDFGKVITDFNFKEAVVKGEAALVELMGVPVAQTSTLPAKRDKKLRDSIAKPKTFIAQTRASASPAGKLALEVLVNGEPRAIKEEGGLAFLAQPIERGQAYAVRLINDTDQEMAAELLIDGINSFQFSKLRHADGPRKGRPLLSAVIVDPHQSVVIPGWHIDNDTTKEFLVTEYADTAAATLGETEKVGTITVNFRASWPKDQPPPADEPATVKGTAGGDGTGFGQAIDQNYQQVPRTRGVIRSSVSVRYTR